MVKRIKSFEEVVTDLEKKYDVHVAPEVMEAMEKAVERDLGKLAENKMLSAEGVKQYFEKAYLKLWCRGKEWPSVSNLIQKIVQKRHYEVSPDVRMELSQLFSALSADTLFAAAAYVVLTRGRERNPITPEDVELVCEDFLSVKPTWMC